jgi:hypothetical protein
MNTEYYECLGTDQLSDQDQGCKIQNKIQDPCKPTDKLCPYAE